MSFFPGAKNFYFGKLFLPKSYSNVINEFRKKYGVQREIAAIAPDILADTFRNMERHVEMCLAENRDHFQHRM